MHNYKFQKYNFIYSEITDESVKKLGSVHTLDLTYCHQITDESVKMLGSLYGLNLYACHKVTKECITTLQMQGVNV